MDDLAHEFTLNHRKRKADTDDGQDPSSKEKVTSPEVIRVDTSAVPTAGSSNAPRQSWLAPDSDHSMWPTSPQVSSPLSSQVFDFPGKPSKRPRIDGSSSSPSSPIIRRHLRKLTAKAPTRPPPTERYGNDIEDIGIVSTADPGPSSGSLLDLRGNCSTSKPPEQLLSSAISQVPIDLNSTHIPSLQPLINRQTLKELDLDAILRNPQLRHDLLFDPGLQFRPTSSRRKRDVSEKYWAAVAQELENGCTCVSFDMAGKPKDEAVCACTQVPMPTTSPVVAFSPALSVVTLRMPSRIRNLLSEFLEVLLLVIQPLSSISGMYVNANTFELQMEEHSAQATYIRSIFDPAFIEQELKHSSFDPSGLFASIGATLKGHCAPMRDRAVESMVQAAKACAPGGIGTRSDAVKAVRLCMEILELMKLDIANHQLQTLRPFLIRTSGQFELKTFKNRKNGDCSLRITRAWLQAAHRSMLTRTHPISHPLYPPDYLEYTKLLRNQQTYLAALKAFVDLVFSPPPNASSSSSSSHASSSLSASSISPLPGYPETSYLDSARLLLLSSDAAEATAIYLFLLLYRQLVFSDSGTSVSHTPQKIDEDQLLKLKSEIRDIGGSRLGYCFLRKTAVEGSKSERKDAERWQNTKRDIVLQVAMRAKEARLRANTQPASPTSPISPVGDAPDVQMIALGQRWADTYFQPDSTLSNMLRDRLRDVIFNSVVTLAYPGRDSATGKLSSIEFFSFGHSIPRIDIPVGAATGMEPLTAEIRSLSEKISRLALIHLNAFLPLYEQDAFWES